MTKRIWLVSCKDITFHTGDLSKLTWVAEVDEIPAYEGYDPDYRLSFREDWSAEKLEGILNEYETLKEENADLRDWVDLSKVVEKHEKMMAAAETYYSLLRNAPSSEALKMAEDTLNELSAPFSNDPAGTALLKLEKIYRQGELSREEKLKEEIKKLTAVINAMHEVDAIMDAASDDYLGSTDRPE